MLSALLSTDRVRVPLGSQNKSELLSELVRMALPDADEHTRSGVLAAVEAREGAAPTAMGAGLAVPHGRTDLVPVVRVAAGLTPGVPDYVGPDGHPVRVVFLVLTPIAASSAHLKLLSQIARLMHSPDWRASLLTAASPEAFLEVIRRGDAVKVA